MCFKSRKGLGLRVFTKLFCIVYVSVFLQTYALLVTKAMLSGLVYSEENQLSMIDERFLILYVCGKLFGDPYIQYYYLSYSAPCCSGDVLLHVLLGPCVVVAMYYYMSYSAPVL